MASIKITISLLVFLAILTYSKANHDYEITEMTLYFQSYTGGENTTLIEIPGPSTPPLNFSRFGALFVHDDPVTKESGAGSVQVARAQGLFVNSALDGSRDETIFSIVFTKGVYKGSTLEMLGSYARLEPVKEVAVVGGTQKFRLARGYATLEIISNGNEYVVFRCNVTVIHY